MTKFFWGLFLFLTFIITLPASWWVFEKTDFAYPFLYDKIGIAQHIEKYAPRNSHNKNDFELTTKAERVELFHGIVQSIQKYGVGLENLVYKNKQQQKTLLLNNAEIIHLKDVANLLDKLKPLVLFLLILWVVILIILRFKRIKLPSAKQLLLSMVFIGLVFAGILLLGPEKIFNQLHVWIFPDNHQWFFYYEESLMSTMMKAPDLFAYIAALWGLMSIFFTAILVKIVKKVL